MKIANGVFSILFVALGSGFSTAAFAGPPVLVTVKNLGTLPAAKVTTTTNEIATQANSNPTPALSIAAGAQNTYTVQSTISPLVNFADLRYTIGAKQCVFYTAYTQTTSGGTTIPNWSKSATPSGGATCTATITSQKATSSNPFLTA